MGRKKLATICEVADCGLTHEESRIVKGMCRKHYKRFMRKGTLELDVVRHVCTLDACGRPHQSRGYCLGHYRRFMKYGDPLEGGDIGTHLFSAEERYANNIKWVGDCLEWQGTLDSSGYGMVRLDSGVVTAAHRYSLSRKLGRPIPKELMVDHMCHNPLCVNPEHLREVTPKQNSEHRQGVSRRSTSGVLGVYWNKNNQNWTVRIGHNYKCYYFGSYKDKDEAERVAIAKRNELFTHNDKDRA